MCVPCAAPAFPLIGTLLLILLFVLASAGMALVKGLQVTPYVITALWRYFSGATLIKGFGVPEQDMEPRRYARQVHAVGRILIPGAAILSLVYPLFFYGLSAVVTGTAIGIGVNRASVWRDNRLESRKARDIEAGTPIRVKAQVGGRS